MNKSKLEENEYTDSNDKMLKLPKARKTKSNTLEKTSAKNPSEFMQI